MTAYIANHCKKKKIFKKREQELRHTIKNDYSQEKINKAAEKLRIAKLNIYKAEFSKNSVLPASNYVPGVNALKWEEMLIDEIVKKYSTKAT